MEVEKLMIPYTYVKNSGVSKMKKLMLVLIVSAMLVPVVMAVHQSTGIISYDVAVGTLDDGNLYSTMFRDGDTMDISEVTGSPGYYLTYTFLVPEATSGNLTSFVHYDGNVTHDVDIDVYNFDSEQWDNQGVIPDGVGLAWVNLTISNFSSHIEENTGLVRVRLIHTSAGNVNHDLFIDVLVLQVHADEVQSTASAVAAGLMWAIVLALGVMVMFFGMKSIFRRI